MDKSTSIMENGLSEHSPTIVVIQDPSEADGIVATTTINSHSRTSSDSTPYCSTDDDGEVKTAPAERIAGNDTGHHGEKQAPIVLTAELKERLVAQAEFYLSDENLRKDGFLLKHVRRNKEGFVNLKLLASFKKLKTICKDHNIVTEALKSSNELVTNEEGTKIRRTVPLPDDLCEKPPVKTVVLSQIPADNPTMDFVSEALAVSGDEIVSVRIVRAGKKFPNDLQAHYARHPEMHSENVAIVEFESAQTALDVVALEFGGDSKYKGMVISLLELGSKLKAKRSKNDGGDHADDEQSTGKREGKSKNNKSPLVGRKKQDRIWQLAASGDEGSSAVSYCSSSDGEQQAQSPWNGRHVNSPRNSPVSSPQMQRYNKKGTTPESSPASSPRGSPWNRRRAGGGGGNQNFLSNSGNSKDLRLSPLVKRISPCSSPETRRKTNNDEQPTGKPQSPWLARKAVLAAEAAAKNNGNTAPIIGVLRQPKGPDGTKGFHSTKLFQAVLPMEVAMS